MGEMQNAESKSTSGTPRMIDYLIGHMAPDVRDQSTKNGSCDLSLGDIKRKDFSVINAWDRSTLHSSSDEPCRPWGGCC